jgi:hypothetical protein
MLCLCPSTTGPSREERGLDFYFEFLPAKTEESISILNFFPPNRGVDFYFEFLPAEIEESISILNFFPLLRRQTGS